MGVNYLRNPLHSTLGETPSQRNNNYIRRDDSNRNDRFVSTSNDEIRHNPSVQLQQENQQVNYWRPFDNEESISSSTEDNQRDDWNDEWERQRNNNYIRSDYSNWNDRFVYTSNDEYMRNPVQLQQKSQRIKYWRPFECEESSSSTEHNKRDDWNDEWKSNSSGSSSNERTSVFPHNCMTWTRISEKLFDNRYGYIIRRMREQREAHSSWKYFCDENGSTLSRVESLASPNTSDDDISSNSTGDNIPSRFAYLYQNSPETTYHDNFIPQNSHPRNSHLRNAQTQYLRTENNGSNSRESTENVPSFSDVAQYLLGNIYDDNHISRNSHPRNPHPRNVPQRGK